MSTTKNNKQGNEHISKKSKNSREEHVISAPDGKFKLRQDRSSGRIIDNTRNKKWNEKISFDSADQLAEEIAALRDTK